MPADGLILIGTRTSVGTMMTRVQLSNNSKKLAIFWLLLGKVEPRKKKKSCSLVIGLIELCLEPQYIPRIIRDHSEYGLSQWETTLHCNVVCHWLSPYKEWSLINHTGSSKFIPHPSELLHWNWDNYTTAPVPAKQPWRTWANKQDELI